MAFSAEFYAANISIDKQGAATMTAQYTKRTKAERTRQLAQEAAMVGVED